MPVSHLNMSITSRITDHHHRRRCRTQIASNMHILAIKKEISTKALSWGRRISTVRAIYIHTHIYTPYIHLLYSAFSLALYLLACGWHSVRFILGQCRLILVTPTCKSASIVWYFHISVAKWHKSLAARGMQRETKAWLGIHVHASWMQTRVHCVWHNEPH